MAITNGITRQWWKESVIYQIYPRSFKDSNGDGIGDLQGIISELDYLKNLGIDVIWLSPCFDSPNADNGYDIRDYREIMTEFGTMADLDALLRGAHERGMRLILDLVANHSSDEHRWFAESRQSKDNPYRDYYIWRPPVNGKEPNDWVSYFSGKTWTLDPTTGEYYLHLFAKKQPDLNWENPKVRQEIHDIMRFWLDKGVDGFRMDVIPFISKDQNFPNYPADFDGDFGKVYASGPRLHDFVQEMHREVMSKYDMMTVGEAAGVTLADTPLLIDERRNELNMIFQFDAVSVDRQSVWWHYKDWNLMDFKAIFTRHDKAMGKYCWNTVFFSNHDNPRPVSRYANDSPSYRVISAKLMATLLLTLKGTPFMYQGDEIGMTNYPFKTIEEYDDIQARNGWQEDVVEKGGDPQAFLDNLIRISRDHARTGMQWNDSKNGGFSAADTTWFCVNPNYPTINAAQAVADPDSVYHFFRKLLSFRKQNEALIYGDYQDLDPNHPSVFCYIRTLDKVQFLVVLNFSNEAIRYDLPDERIGETLVFSNYDTESANAKIVYLKAWEARIYRNG